MYRLMLMHLSFSFIQTATVAADAYVQVLAVWRTIAAFYELNFIQAFDVLRTTAFKF